MVILDTHIWIWWVHGVPRLSKSQAQAIREHVADGLCVSAISCWEVAKLVERGRLDLSRPTRDWLRAATGYPGVRLLGLSPEIAAESAELPDPFHRDPADQIIVATARVYDVPLLTSDQRILAYPHVRAIG